MFSKGPDDILSDVSTFSLFTIVKTGVSAASLSHCALTTPCSDIFRETL